MTTEAASAAGRSRSSLSGEQQSVFLAGLGLILGIAVQVLFYGKPLGISFFIWAALCILALGLSARVQKVKGAAAMTWLAGPILFFAAMVFLRLEPLSVTLSLAAAVGLLLLWVRTFRIGDLAGFGWTDFGLTWVFVPLEAWAAPWPALRATQKRLLRGRRGRTQAMAVLRGAVLTFPILLLLVVLLSGADIIFADRVQEALRWFDLERVVDWIGRGTLILLSGLFSLGCLVMALRPLEYRKRAGSGDPLIRSFLGFTEAVMVLAGVNLVFGLFVAIQFTYLFGGEGNITTAGYTYAEYARRGFGELVAVSVVSLGLILALGMWARREHRRHRGWFNGLSVALVVQMGVILASALQRLLLYENAYGFTRLRTYTHVAILWMAGLFLAFIVLLLAGRMRHFALVAAAGALGFAASLNLVNVDAFIVERNASRMQQIGEIDLRYLLQLSEDALPALAALQAAAPTQLADALAAELACWAAQSGLKQYRWPSTHLSRLRARGALLSLADSLAGHQVWWDRQDGWLVDVTGEGQPCLRQSSWLQER